MSLTEDTAAGIIMPLWVLESLEWVRTGPQPRGSVIYVMGPETQISSWRPGKSHRLSPKKGRGPDENSGWPVVMVHGQRKWGWLGWRRKAFGPREHQQPMVTLHQWKTELLQTLTLPAKWAAKGICTEVHLHPFQARPILLQLCKPALSARSTWWPLIIRHNPKES